jgi:hypothetical protein
MKCPEAEGTLRLVRRRDADGLSAAEQGLLSRHLAGCSACSEEAIRLDPTLLFSALGASAEGEGREPGRAGRAPSGGARRGAHRPFAEAGSARETDLLVAGVLAAVDVERSRRRLGSSRRPMLAAAGLALVGVGLVGLLVARGRLVKEDPAAPAEAAASARPAERAARFAARPLIEDLNNPGARVYEFSGVSPKEPRVVFIANPDADI